MTFKDLGTIRYNEAYHLQLHARERLKSTLLPEDEIVYLVEHTPVYTLGKHGNTENMLLSETEMQKRGVQCIRIERGGDITFHGPGQLVVYPVINLRNHRLGVKEYVNRLEQMVIDTVAEWGIRGERIEGATGVWINSTSTQPHKICAIGVSVSHFCTMHGLALNVNTDLTYFKAINPCGFSSDSVTSIQKETRNEVIDMQTVKESFINHFTNLI